MRSHGGADLNNIKSEGLLAPAYCLDLLNDSEQADEPIGRLKQPNQLFRKKFLYKPFHRAVLWLCGTCAFVKISSRASHLTCDYPAQVISDNGNN